MYSRVAFHLCFYQEIVTTTCLQPTVAMCSDPDYINQCIAVWIADSTITYQSILDLIRYSGLIRGVENGLGLWWQARVRLIMSAIETMM